VKTQSKGRVIEAKPCLIVVVIIIDVEVESVGVRKNTQRGNKAKVKGKGKQAPNRRGIDTLYCAVLAKKMT
jgi:hypothetical protein